MPLSRISSQRRVGFGDSNSMTMADQDRRVRRFEQIVGNSPALRAVLEQAKCVAPADSSVLIRGETGTGKELIAHAIHNASRRSGNALIKLNCSAIPSDLLESELFRSEEHTSE